MTTDILKKEEVISKSSSVTFAIIEKTHKSSCKLKKCMHLRYSTITKGSTYHPNIITLFSATLQISHKFLDKYIGFYLISFLKISFGRSYYIG